MRAAQVEDVANAVGALTADREVYEVGRLAGILINLDGDGAGVEAQELDDAALDPVREGVAVAMEERVTDELGAKLLGCGQSLASPLRKRSAG